MKINDQALCELIRECQQLGPHPDTIGHNLRQLSRPDFTDLDYQQLKQQIFAEAAGRYVQAMDDLDIVIKAMSRELATNQIELPPLSIEQEIQEMEQSWLRINWLRLSLVHIPDLGPEYHSYVLWNPPDPSQKPMVFLVTEKRYVDEENYRPLHMWLDRERNFLPLWIQHEDTGNITSLPWGSMIPRRWNQIQPPMPVRFELVLDKGNQRRYQVIKK